MRTEEEKQRQIEGLENLKKTLPEYSRFEDANWEAIDAQIAIIKGEKKYEDFDDEEDENIEIRAYAAQQWLEEPDEDDLFELN